MSKFRKLASIFAAIVILTQAQALAKQPSSLDLATELIKIRAQGTPSEKEAVVEKVLAMDPESVAVSKTWRANIFNQVGSILSQLNRNQEALDLLQKTLDLVKDDSTQEGIFTRYSLLRSLDISYESFGRYTDAIDALKQAEAVRLKGSLSPEIDKGVILCALAKCYSENSEYVAAFNNFEKGVSILGNASGGELRLYYVQGLADYAQFCIKLRRVQFARELLELGISDAEQNSLRSAQVYGIMLLDAANVCSALGDVEAAEKYLLTISKSESINEQTKQQANSRLSTALAGDYAAALPAREKAKRFNAAAMTFLNVGKLDKAESNFKRAIALAPNDAHILQEAKIGLAFVGLALKDIDTNFPILCQAVNDSLAEFWSSDWSTERELIVTAKSMLLGGNDILINFLSQQAEPKQQHLESLYLTLIREKGLLQERMVHFYAALRQPSSDSRKYKTAIAQLITLETLPSPESKNENKLFALQSDIARSEQAITMRVRQLLKEAPAPSIEQVKAAIPNDCIFFDYFRAKTLSLKSLGIIRNPDEVGKDRYFAFAISRTDPIKLVDLGLAEDIDPLLDRFNSQVRAGLDLNESNDQSSLQIQEVKQTLRELHRKLIGPVKKSKTANLIISGTDKLSLFPFECLVDMSDRYLVESKTVSYVDSVRDLFRKATENQKNPKALLVGAPDFALPVEEHLKFLKDKTVRIFIDHWGSRTITPWEGLKETADEVHDVFAIMKKAGIPAKSITVLLEKNALEDKVKLFENPDFLHITTHGYFSKTSLSPLRAKTVTDEQISMMHSCIVLAGADNFVTWRGNEPLFDDGYLSASELSLKDLSNTRLAFLCACDTGLGVPTNGQGVYGLRRALRLSGVENSVISLFRIPAKESAQLAADFYAEYLQSGNAPQSLCSAKRRMLNSRPHPVFWAGLVVDLNSSPVVKLDID